MVGGWTPYTDCVVIRCRGKHLMVDRVPRNTVDCPTVTAENSNGFVPPHMEDVHLVVLRTRSNKGLIKTTKAAVDRVKALSDTHKLPNKGPGLDIPHVDALCSNVEQGVAVRVVGDERHDGVILLDHWGVRQLFKVIRPDSMVGVRSQDVPPISSVSQALHPHSLPAVKNCAMGVTLIKLAPVASHSQPSAIRGPRGTSKRVFPTVRDLCFQPPGCHFPQPHLWTIVWATYSQSG